MIDIHDGQITDLFSNSLRHNPETIAIAYAVLQEKRRILSLVERTRLMSAVDSLDERILDYLAVELRTPAYEDSLQLETKRTLIKGTLPFYSKLGTPVAVDWVTNAIFGNGGMTEWFQYSGDPHHFRININGSHNVFSIDKFEGYIRAVFAVKRLTSWLDKIVITIDIPPFALHIGGGVGAQAQIGIPLEPDVYDFQKTIYTGGGVGVQPEIGVPVEPDEYELESQVQVGGTAGAQPSIGVPAGEDHFSFRDTLHTGGAAGSKVVAGIPAGYDAYDFQDTLRTGGRFSDRTVLPVQEDTKQPQVKGTVQAGGVFSGGAALSVPEDTTQPSATTILRTGGVHTIISNLSKGD